MQAADRIYIVICRTDYIDDVILGAYTQKNVARSVAHRVEDVAKQEDTDVIVMSTTMNPPIEEIVRRLRLVK